MINYPHLNPIKIFSKSKFQKDKNSVFPFMYKIRCLEGMPEVWLSNAKVFPKLRSS